MTHSFFPGASTNSHADEPQLREYRKQIESLPVTMRPSLNHQLADWDMLFPFEQKQVTAFLHGLDSLTPAQLAAITRPLRDLETKMGVEHWNFSESGDTMENASLLARSEYYAEWRHQVQQVFEAINNNARAEVPVAAKPARLIVLVLPQSLPVDSPSGGKQWDSRMTEFSITGDTGHLCELLLQGHVDVPGIGSILAQDHSTSESDLWLLDADAELADLLPAEDRHSACSLNYSLLKPFRDRFLAEVNRVPKNLEASDQVLAEIRREDWDRWWPANLPAQPRLRKFVVDLFLSGNGALIFSNAFVEWAASEALRRARPRIMVARFGLRAKPKPFTGIAIFENQHTVNKLPDVDDPQGSAIDAAILARYIWLAAARYPEQDQTICLCVSEFRNRGCLISPQGKSPDWSHDHPASVEEIHKWLAGQMAV
jgi:hypothetical protein